MNKSTIVIVIYVIGLIFGALVLDMWSATTSPKALLGIGWTALLLIGLFPVSYTHLTLPTILLV